ncbi:MFS transporter [Salinisphaera sp. G21_0]|uniref:MFS transporter n=1 Tax=Salinisphaera sp. G21_0 TaxID=2821094 RepID=UPI001AD99F5F|nr:MFS transporter [Salinisphaera sp. G21_0]MBO9482907.1 MFS transporter [Salinisphaera sp. G21_0]
MSKTFNAVTPEALTAHEELQMATKTLSMVNRIGYGLGDLANTLSFGMTAGFLLVYYTDVLGISAAAAGTLFLVARVWDAINDPMMGTLCDKLFQKHNGVGDKFRPFLLKGSWLMLVTGILVFWAPEGLSDTQKLIWAYVTYIVWGMCYTFVNIPYGSLATVMTRDPGERAALAGARAMGSVVGQVVPTIIVPVFLSTFADDIAKAYLYSITVLGTGSLICYLLAYRFTEEHIKHEPAPVTCNVKFMDTVRTLGKNKPFLCVSLSSVLLLTAIMGQGSVLVYYLSQNLGGAVWLISVNGVIQVVGIVILGTLIGKLVARFGARKIMMTAFCTVTAASLAAFLLPTSISGLFVFIALGMPAFLVTHILVWANVADCIDYNYEISGQRQEGLIYSSYSFMRKMGQAIAGFIAGMGLSVIGYDATLDVQSDSTLLGIKVIMFILPAICAAICALLYKTMWTLDSRKKDQAPDAVAEPAIC